MISSRSTQRQRKGRPSAGLRVGDVLDFAGIDPNHVPGDQAFVLIGSKGFSNVAGQLRVYTSTSNAMTYVSGDTNGDGVSDFTVSLNGIHSLSGSGLVL